jgi:serine/threonine protein kinase
MPAEIDYGELVLGDFGVARLVGAAAEEGASGTLGYMAPEQRRGEITPAADVHAAGVILVELLCGAPALAGWLGDRARLLRGEARWDGALPDGIPRPDELRALAASLMAPDPAARPTADAARRALAAMLA